jgi:DNA-binding MarR family transcriptional regulator
MTVSPSRTAPGTGSAVEELAAGLTSLLQALQRMRADLARSRSAEGDRECAAHVLLFPLCLEGPLRQAELAELVNADPSTVSRHVARLVDEGLVTRVPDERDGRASRLVVTERGTATAETMRRERADHLREVTADWNQDDLETLSRLLRRLASDIGGDSRPPAAAPR